MDEATARRGARAFLRLAAKKHIYSTLPFEEPVQSLRTHPLDPNYEGFVALCGSYGVTASMAPWVESLIDEIVATGDPPELDLIQWRCPLGDAGNYLVYEARFCFPAGHTISYLAIGFADFSGEGGRGHRQMDAICQWLAHALPFVTYQQREGPREEALGRRVELANASRDGA